MGDIEVTLMAKTQFRQLTDLLKIIEDKLDKLIGIPKANLADKVPQTMTGTDQEAKPSLTDPVDTGSPGAKIAAMKKNLEGSDSAKK